ncbi:hypothetical protein V5P93_003759 [Actinokineospora auranticolor]|uniref:hypothetical protein n=1 Tax=Actinokineospora auranticolor TaxID=155976 RepID=UPI001FE8C704|nr:hypothetical protein [Actinokineospora auranticolor]
MAAYTGIAPVTLSSGTSIKGQHLAPSAAASSHGRSSSPPSPPCPTDSWPGVGQHHAVPPRRGWGLTRRLIVHLLLENRQRVDVPAVGPVAPPPSN